MQQEANDMVREAAREAATEALQLYSKDVDLKFERSERRMLEKVETSIERSFEKYMGMTAIDHAIAHDEASKAVNMMQEVKKEVRTFFIRVVLSGMMAITGVFGFASYASADNAGAVMHVREETSDENRDKFLLK